MSIHRTIKSKVKTELYKALITALEPEEDEEEDPTQAGAVIIGPLQGTPSDPDQARISVEVYEGDPDNFHSGSVTAMKSEWVDEIVEVAVGGLAGYATWKRRFTVKARCLFVNTGENHDKADDYASTVKNRIERTILAIDWAGVNDAVETVIQGALTNDMKSEMLQGGGPPDAYDYYIKVRFSVLTEATA